MGQTVEERQCWKCSIVCFDSMESWKLKPPGATSSASLALGNDEISCSSQLCPSRHTYSSWAGALWRRFRTYVFPSYSKIGSQPETISMALEASYTWNLPKFVGPLAGTIFPWEIVRRWLDFARLGLLTSVRPWKMIGSWPGPSQ